MSDGVPDEAAVTLPHATSLASAASSSFEPSVSDATCKTSAIPDVISAVDIPRSEPIAVNAKSENVSRYSLEHLAINLTLDDAKKTALTEELDKRDITLTCDIQDNNAHNTKNETGYENKSLDLLTTTSGVKTDSSNQDQCNAMGNSQQTSRKTVQSDDETPDEAKIKCCQIPKKKLKDKTARACRVVSSDDMSFEADEVYPFDRRTRSDIELAEPVELEPFEIVDTDDIRFVPGAGTSAVIKPTGEPRFRAIPEDTTLLSESQENLNNEQTEVKGIYFDKGARMEAGTATAHSTFEFKQVKPKAKQKQTALTEKPQYENILKSESTKLKTERALPALPVSDQPVSPTSPTPSSGSSSLGVSRKNSTDAMQKPARKSKVSKTLSDVTNNSSKSKDNTCTDDLNQPKRQRQKSDKSPAIRDSEIDRNIDSVMMLTQTMFSGPKKIDRDETALKEIEASSPNNIAPQMKYENVGVCVKLESKGLALAHKDGREAKTVAGKTGDNVDRVKEAIKISKTTEAKEEQINYENVGVCVKLEALGLSIAHKDSPKHVEKQTASEIRDVLKKKGHPSSDKEKFELPKEVKDADKNKERRRRERKASDDKEIVCINRNNSNNEIVSIQSPDTDYIEMNKGNDRRSGVSSQKTDASVEQDKKPQGILHISDTGTLIIKSFPKPPSHAPSSEKGESHYYENDIIDKESTDVKVPFLDSTVADEGDAIPTGEKEKHLLKLKDEAEEDAVPPPSPSTMNALAEVVEEEEEEDEFEDFDEEKRRRSLEMFEFTENVCKRLSQLLEQSPSREESDVENEDYLFKSGTFKPENNDTENIYETIRDKERFDGLDEESRKVLRKSLDMSTDTSLQLPTRSESSGTLKRTSGDSETYKTAAPEDDGESDDDLPEYFYPTQDRQPLHMETDETEQRQVQRYDNVSIEDSSLSTLQSFRVEDDTSDSKEATGYDNVTPYGSINNALTLPIRAVESGIVVNTKVSTDLKDLTPTAESQQELTPLTEMATAREEDIPLQFDASGRQSVTCTESDLDISEHRDDMSTDSMMADDEAEETMEILFTKTYTEPEAGAEVFLSCTVVNSAYRGPGDAKKPAKSDTWLSDEALEYFEANASDLMSTAFLKAKKEMKDIQVCLQGLRRQMEHFHSDAEDDGRMSDMDRLTPDYYRLAPQRAVTD